MSASMYWRLSKSFELHLYLFVCIHAYFFIFSFYSFYSYSLTRSHRYLIRSCRIYPFSFSCSWSCLLLSCLYKFTFLSIKTLGPLPHRRAYSIPSYPIHSSMLPYPSFSYMPWVLCVCFTFSHLISLLLQNLIVSFLVSLLRSYLDLS